MRLFAAGLRTNPGNLVKMKGPSQGGTLLSKAARAVPMDTWD